MKLASRAIRCAGPLVGFNVFAWLGLTACGGSVDMSGTDKDAGAHDGSVLYDANGSPADATDEAVIGHLACAAASSCAEDALTDPERVEVPGDDATIESAGSFCGYDSGPSDASPNAGRAATQCNPGWECVPLNGHWACCTIPSAGGLSTCFQPLLSEP
jgi:hypothetical protein